MTWLSQPYVTGPSAWGDVTVKQKLFCELHFYTSPYIAEFINTISNLTYVLLGIWGARNALRNGEARIVWLSYVSLAGVGIGSTAFHSSLKYEGQLADQISMLYATATILYGSVSIVLKPQARLVFAFLLSLSVFLVTGIHIFMGTSVVFRVSWAIMLNVVFYQCTWLIITKVSSSRERSDMRNLALCGTVYFLGGFGLWNIDFIFCEELRSIRASLGMPLGFLFELHGWWHIFTSLGAYHFIVLIEDLRACILIQDQKGERSVQLVWPHAFSLPYLKVSKILESRKSK